MFHHSAAGDPLIFKTISHECTPLHYSTLIHKNYSTGFFLSLHKNIGIIILFYLLVQFSGILILKICDVQRKSHKTSLSFCWIKLYSKNIASWLGMVKIYPCNNVSTIKWYVLCKIFQSITVYLIVLRNQSICFWDISFNHFS